ncbi:hypothetical protein V6N13_025489 [Hibiscus sabdariffa]|uniref:Prolamin-like domain-containing protein n=1 Tax=Hibiscus sabdariffa TaxID=183260 RepID=A0ABR2P8J9_9ROSI
MIAASMVVADDEFLPPEPEPGFYKALVKCGKKISLECGKSVVKAVLKDRDISNKCCVHKMGRSCHEDLLWYLISQPKIGANATHVFIKGPQVYNSCVSKVGLEI